jgi:hypothetical protein
MAARVHFARQLEEQEARKRASGGEPAQQPARGPHRARYEDLMGLVTNAAQHSEVRSAEAACAHPRTA